MKKRKLLIAILTGLCACFMSATLFTACGEKHTHAYTSQTTTEATCTEKGVITYTCSCNDSYTEEIPALGHDEKTHQAQEPTCTEIGWEEYVTCEREGCEYSTYKGIPATGVHTWDKGEETKAPTCTKEGEMTYTCTVCKTTTKTEPIDKLPHEHNTEKWTSNATYHWHECECGDKKDEEKHTAGAPATATTPQTCTVCGYVLQAETGILFNTLTVEGTKVYGKVSNDTEIFSFINEITVKGNATYVVDVNMSCNDPIESKTVELSVGDNKFYVLEKIGNDVKLFTVTIRRRPMYEVTFNANGGTSVEKQVIEEDDLATEPETTRTGYTFTGWGYDFTQPITQTTKITASWSVNKDTKYTVKYYLQNLGDNEYTLHETVELTGETDTTAYGETERYAHFTYNASKSVISGNINGDGSRVLSVYYTRDNYDIIANNNNAKAGTATSVNGTYRYEKEFTLTATTNAGYTWLGWYDGETLACATEEFKFTTEKDVTYTATWSANTDTKYTVIYYLQNLDDNNYTPYETVELTGETDTPTAEVDIREYTHFMYNESKSVISGNIDGNGNRVLSVYYTRNTYTLSVNSSAGAITNAGAYKYGTEVTSTVTPHLGYEFIGWYNQQELLSADLTYTFTATQNATAKFEAKEEMSNFNFTSTTTACSIISIKDNTVMEIFVPYYVTSIGSSAFYGCNSLTSITVDANNPSYQSIDGNLYTKGGTTFIQYAIGKTATSFEIPDSVTSIGPSAFRSCSSLTNVVIPDSVTSIGEWAFYKCENLTIVVIPDSVTSIGSSAFYNCDSLTSVVIPDSVTSIGSSAFYNCNSLTSVVIPDSVTSIGSSAFYNCDSLTSVDIGDSVTSIGSFVFYNCSSLAKLNYNATACADLTISDEVFHNAGQKGDGITVTIGANVTKIPAYLFYSYYPSYATFSYVPKITSVVFEEGSVCESIGYAAFYNCRSLTSVVIPDSVTSIGSYAFYDCSSLAKLNYNATACADLTISDDVFHNAGEKGDGITVTIGANVTKIPACLFYSYDPYSTFSYVPKITSVVFEEGSVCESIGSDAFSYCSSLTSVVIPDSVTSIGECAFRYCSSLTEITLPFVGATKDGTSNTHFGYIFGASNPSDNSRYVPTSLKKVTITCATSIASSAFNSCSSLTSVVIGDRVTSIGNYAFYYCGSLTSVVIPDSVTSIGSYVFYDCSSLTSITIPDSVTSIGECAFRYCSSLTEITLPFVGGTKGGTSHTHFGYIFGASRYSDNSSDVPTSLKKVTITSVTSIGSNAFRYCSSLTSVVIPDSVTSIGSSAFSGCSSLTEITLPFVGATKDGTSNTHFGYIFGASSYSDNSRYVPTSLKKVTITSATSIGGYAFRSCSSLTNVVIPDSVTSIGYEAFSGCSSLTSVYITNITAWCNISFGSKYTNPLSNGASLYLNNELVTELIIPNDVTTISSYAFNGCNSLTSVVIPDSVTSISSYAFSGCGSLTSVVIPDSVTSIGYEAFASCSSLTEIALPFVGATKDGTSNTHFGYIFGASSHSDNSRYVPTSLKKVTITSATSIGNNAFAHCSSLTSVTIPDSVTSIGYGVFYNCSSLTSITIPDSVTSIGSSAFSGCSSLTSVVIGDSVTSIGEWAFSGCSSLTEITLPFVGATKDGTSNTHFGYIFGASSYSDNSRHVPTSLKKVTITCATSIGNYAFSGCGSLTSVVIPDSVMGIGQSAFSGCRSLMSIEIPDSVTFIYHSAFSGCSSLTIYCEVTSKPSGWDSSWKDSDCPVYWYRENQPATTGNYWHYDENGNIAVW